MRVALYCRLSEEDRNKASESDDSLSIQNQKAMLLKHAQEQGWDVVGIYSDDDYTGADIKRPAFRRMLDDASKKQFDIILCKSMSRFVRDSEVSERYLHRIFPRLGIRFVSLTDNVDTAVKANKKSRQIMGLVNEWYLEDMSASIKSVLDHRREQGFHIGSFALYGYEKDPEHKGRLIIDEEAASVVREVYTMFESGYGKHTIARILNERGVPNPTEYKRRKGLRYKPPASKASTLWRYPAISDMLTNRMYLGDMVQGRYGNISYKDKRNVPRPKEQWIIVENTHEPIISHEQWERVQGLIAQKARPFAGGEIGVFARKVVCGDCGCIMRSCKNHGRYYLQCTTRHVSRDACGGAFISVDRLEETVLCELDKMSEAYMDRDELERGVELFDHFQMRKDRLLADLDKYCKMQMDYAKGVHDLYLDKTRGVIDDDMFCSLSREFSKQKKETEQSIRACEQEIADIEERMAEGDDRRTRIEQYIHPKKLTRSMCDALIDHIVIAPREQGKKSNKIEIYWRF